MRTNPSLEDFEKGNSFEAFNYIWKKGKWYTQDQNDKWVVLTKKLINGKDEDDD